MTSQDDVRQLMGAVFDNLSADDVKQASRREEFIFHMMDWIDDAEKLVSLYNDPSGWDPTEAARFVYGFLAHVVPHLQRATDLLDSSTARDGD